ncbi:hypothetical protein FEM03_13485 [Phragmitibacter flavus]|uniref:Uncharacterized protein n=1 Tax=Phragmitibacter flavus TaxID=2576071 RepID=A0A5R8KD80_9BACT|nr:DUF6304 family protein [Phragmitibacter flavus]TLD70197.1 hypothetical protein FEM03_13485 [Phragmitibacter flavus]
MSAIFRDKFGKERIAIQTTGSALSTTIRGIDFSGTDFESLTPATASDLFELCHGYLCGCELSITIPARVVSADGFRLVEIHAEINLGYREPRGGLYAAIVRNRLALPEFAIMSRGDSGWFEDELLSLATQLPDGFMLEACITCGLSDYSPYGHGCFGCMACFRGVADEYRRVQTKAGIFAIWDRLTEYVQETHYCQHYEPRPLGRGYRG